MRGKYGITDMLLDSGLLSEPRSAKELSAALGVAVGSINSALHSLYQRSEVSREVTTNGFIWWTARVHWIWGSAISRCDPETRVYHTQPPVVFGERGRLSE